MEASAEIPVRSYPKAVKLLLVLIAITVVLSFLYAAQYYAGGPVRLAVVSELYDVAVSPNNELIAAGAEDGKVRVWEVPSDFTAVLAEELDLSKAGNWPRHTLSGHKAGVISVAFTPDGSTLVSTDRSGEVREWDLAAVLAAGESTDQSAKVLEMGGGPLNDVDLNVDRRLLASVAESGLVQVWDLAAGERLQSFGPNASTKLAVSISADGRLVAAGDGPDIQLWDVASGEPFEKMAGYWEDETTQQSWLGHTKDVTALAFSPDSQILASGSADTTIIFWDVSTAKIEWVAEGHWATVTRLVFSPDGNAMLSAGADNKARTYRMPGGKSTAIYEGHLSTVTGVAFGPLPNTITTCGDDGTMRVWETANQKVIHMEWSRYGMQPLWGKTLSVWMVVSGVIGLVSLWGLWRLRTWSHLLALGLYLLGPIVVLGLPLFEVLSYPLSAGTKLQIAWPLILLALWYAGIVFVLRHEPVAMYYEAPHAAALADQLVASRRTLRTRFGIFALAVWLFILVALYSVLRRFNLDVAFMGHFFSFIMEGAWITVRVSALSILLAVVLALLGALGRLSKNPIANGVSSFYISLIRGTPLLVQIYIWYLGLPRLGIVLQGEVAGILALGVNYGAYMTEIFRAGIQAIGKGQHEAAEALGMTRGQTFRRIVLPQAFRIVIPPIGNEFIAMMKDSSLVSVMAVWELTFRAQKIGRQNFRNMETFLIAAAFYWILTVIFQFLQGKLEEYMARGERR